MVELKPEFDQQQLVHALEALGYRKIRQQMSLYITSHGDMENQEWWRFAATVGDTKWHDPTGMR